MFVGFARTRRTIRNSPRKNVPRCCWAIFFVAVALSPSEPSAQEPSQLLQGGNPSGYLKFGLREQRANYLDFGQENAPEPETNTILPNIEGSLNLPFYSFLSMSVRSSYENDLAKTMRFYNAMSVDGGANELGAYLDLSHSLSRNMETNLADDDLSGGFLLPSIQQADALLGLEWSKRNDLRLNLEGFLFLEYTHPNPRIEEDFYENTLEAEASLLFEKHFGGYHTAHFEAEFINLWYEDIGGSFDDLERGSWGTFAQADVERTFILGNQLKVGAFNEVFYSERYESQRFLSFGANVKLGFKIGLDATLTIRSKAERHLTSPSFLKSPEDEDLFASSNEVEFSWEWSRVWRLEPNTYLVVEHHDKQDQSDGNHLFLEAQLPLTYGSKSNNIEFGLNWNRDRFYDFSYGRLVDTVDEVLGVTNYADPLPPEADEFGASIDAETTFWNVSLNASLEGSFRLYVWKDKPSEPRGQQYADEFFVAATLYGGIGLSPNLNLEMNLFHTLRHSDDGYNTGADIEGGFSITYSF